MTDRQRMAILSEGNAYVQRIRDLIAEAKRAGFEIAVDPLYDGFESSSIEGFDIDLSGPGAMGYIDTIVKLEY